MPDANVIRLGHDIRLQNLRPLHARIDDLILWSGYEKIILDLTDLRVSFADSALPFVAMIHHYTLDDAEFDIILPKDSQLKRLFLNANWAHFINPRKFELKTDSSFGHIPARKFDDPSTQHELHQTIMERVLELFRFLDRESLKALDWSLYEITDNVLTHAESRIGGLVQLTIKRNSKEIQFVVSDTGMGIPKSLRSGFHLIRSDEHALEECIKEGVTRGTGQGNGLFGTYQVAAVSGGAFSINSGSAYLALSRQGDVHIRPQAGEFLGTSVDCTISFSRPLVLERALRFNDRPHIPQDVLDIKYQDDDVLSFCLREEVRSFGSRMAGFQGRTKLRNLVNMMKPEIIVFDCGGISVMSSSFADELIAKFVIESGIDLWKKKILLKNCSRLNENIIERSLNQRSK